MYLNPDLAAQLARDHQRQMLAQASRRHPHVGPAPRGAGGAARIVRGLAAAIARAGAAAAQAPGAVWPARPHLVGESAAPARPQSAAADGTHARPGQRHPPGPQPQTATQAAAGQQTRALW